MGNVGGLREIGKAGQALPMKFDGQFSIVIPLALALKAVQVWIYGWHR